MKVTTSCSGRFHIFDQASQLERRGVLHRFIVGYPKFMTRRWGIPDNKVTSLLANGIYARAADRTPSWIPSNVKSKLAESVHGKFSKRLAKNLPLDSEVFIGLSSFCLEAIIKAKQHGIISIVDHGSLHQRFESQLMQEESELLGTTAENNLAPDWIIEKEDKEFESADYVILLSNAAKESLVKNGIPADKIFVNNCGVDLSQFSLKGDKQDNTFRIIFCGAITPRKGIYYLLRAFSELNLKNAELCVVGGTYDPTFKIMLEKYMTPNTRFIGTLPQNQLVDIYNQSSIFVLPSIADGFGMVVPQAMACGLPVIVTDHVGAADVVTEGKDGFVIPIRDVEAMKEKIITLYENPELVENMGKEANIKAKNSLSWDAYGDRLTTFLDTIAERKAA